MIVEIIPTCTCRAIICFISIIIMLNTQQRCDTTISNDVRRRRRHIAESFFILAFYFEFEFEFVQNNLKWTLEKNRKEKIRLKRRKEWTYGFKIGWTDIWELGKSLLQKKNLWERVLLKSIHSAPLIAA